MKTNLYLWSFFLFLGIQPVFSLTVEMREVSDNTPTNNLRFASARNLDVFSQSGQYLVIRYDSPDELEGLKVFSDNRTWYGGTERGGMVNTPPNRRVPVYWKAFDVLQTNLSMNAQNELSWKNLRDQNQSGFLSLDPAETNVPVYSNVTYIYFAAKMNSTTATAFYSTPLNVSNIIGPNTGGDGPSGEDGFGSFSQMFIPSKNPIFEIPFNMSMAGEADMALYDRKGSKIKQLVSGPQNQGSQIVTWNGRSDDEVNVASGLYFLALKINGKIYRKKIVVIR